MSTVSPPSWVTIEGIEVLITNEVTGLKATACGPGGHEVLARNCGSEQTAKAIATLALKAKQRSLQAKAMSGMETPDLCSSTAQTKAIEGSSN